METSKTCQGIEQIKEKERQRGLGRERDNDSGERKWHGLEREDGVS
jgi:hypothetical protein